MNTDNALIIYTDGSSLPKPRRGGIGIRYLLIDEDGEQQIYDPIKYPGYKSGTNQQMELQACVVAINDIYQVPGLDKYDKAIIYSDSKYVVEGYNYAKYQWSKNKWKTAHEKPIDNVPIWEKLLKNIDNLDIPVYFKKVKGHSGNPHNDAVDKAATESARNALNDPLIISHTSRKTSKKSTKQGLVKVEGQVLNIRIISTEALKSKQGIKYNYRYQVTSEDSEYYDLLDFAYSDIYMSRHHTYIATFNDEQKFPKILFAEPDKT